jgi:MEDS: MEthanogen/methylotroph, DcmR Sensory domain
LEGALKVAKLITINSNEAPEVLAVPEFPEHSILIYPNLSALRKVYSQYAKKRLEEGNEILLIIPYYETTDSVRAVLRNVGVNVSKYEKENILVIMDSEKAYQKSEGVYNFNLLLNLLTKRADALGKRGVSIFADGGLFFLYGREEELVADEMDLPTEFDTKCRCFCTYHSEDFKNFSKQQEEQLLKHHYRCFYVRE